MPESVWNAVAAAAIPVALGGIVLKAAGYGWLGFGTITAAVVLAAVAVRRLDRLDW